MVRCLNPASAFGLEDKSTEERITELLNAGIDMIGGESLTNNLVELIKTGIISEKRIDESLKRIMKQKFQLGLFDNPYIKLSSLKKS
jgi:beta-glucosidase